MKRFLAVLVLLVPLLGCQGANDVTGPEPGCYFSESDFGEKNGPCEPCEGLHGDFENKNKPCIPD